ncbi:hypothetical protein K3495_g2140 [Podosphaera aphanis]|nr:hypothetical protein K3495_g2140 [Podosphaera aphanis]
MVLNTATFVGAVAPVAVSTFVSHYLHRNLREHKPTAEISYDEGLALIRKFLIFASHNTVEELQNFTTQSVPLLHLVKTDIVYIPEQHLTKAAHTIQVQLKPRGICDVGGKSWWQWRSPGTKLSAEWIEARNIYKKRRKGAQDGERVMFYVHGGAYYFGSVDVHRYQLQKHARKLKGRVFAPRYRLAPQFPFPCGLQDCLAAYMYLITIQAPNTIVLAGDSAGAGMILSMMVIMRDQGIPLPSGAILISPWVDLTHSFPSIGEEHPLDYIPSCGFHHKPSKSWPPMNGEYNIAGKKSIDNHIAHQELAAPQKNKTDTIQAVLIGDNSTNDIEGDKVPKDDTNSTESKRNISITVDGEVVEINDQVHMYVSNHLATHPLVSPVFQPSLGGLPPLLILTGDGEMLRDEQIYLAHKAANPSKYTPPDAFLDKIDTDQGNKWAPTNVQLQVWEGLCHAAPTLSFTRPAKHMYRSIAQFSSWALTRSQGRENHDLGNDNHIHVSLTDVQEHHQKRNRHKSSNAANVEPTSRIGKAGDPLPSFKDHMIRQRVDCNGFISPLEPESELPACNLDPSQIGLMKEKLVLQWLDVKRKRDIKYASSMQRIQNQHTKDALKYNQLFQDGETPPPTALVGRSIKNGKHKETTLGVRLRLPWRRKNTNTCDSKPKEKAIIKETAIESTDLSYIRSSDHANSLSLAVTEESKQLKTDSSSVIHEENPDVNKSQITELEVKKSTQTVSTAKSDVREPFFLIQAPSNENLVTNSDSKFAINPNFPTAETIVDRKRPIAGGIAYPFTLKGHSATTSMLTLTSLNDDDPQIGAQGLDQQQDEKKTT